ncbi:MAG: hypothetical protein KTR25_15245 [Myxococcales bacterium]|nr:hypothetical protein [Myxococcales bacterium]
MDEAAAVVQTIEGTRQKVLLVYSSLEELWAFWVSLLTKMKMKRVANAAHQVLDAAGRVDELVGSLADRLSGTGW